MIIDGRIISVLHSPYIVAEVSCNHGGSLDRAMELIRAARDAGADAVKFQAYTADTITMKSDRPHFMAKDGPWKGRNLYDLYKKTETPFHWFPTLFAYARAIGITPFASVFDHSSVDMLEKIDCPAYKIASMEITDIPLISYAAATKKPLIISTGMASDREVAVAISAAAIKGAPVMPLHCVSGYPVNPAHMNLLRIKDLMVGECEDVGISDHTVGVHVPIAAVALGASVIEKHLWLGTVKTEDSEFSASPPVFKHMVSSVRAIHIGLNNSLMSKTAESSSRQFRRSLYAVEDIKCGSKFTKKNVRSIRPSGGLPPEKLDWVLSRKARKAIKKGTPLNPSMIG